jgi:hypothetical protein
VAVSDPDSPSGLVRPEGLSNRTKCWSGPLIVIMDQAKQLAYRQQTIRRTLGLLVSLFMGSFYESGSIPGRRSSGRANKPVIRLAHRAYPSVTILSINVFQAKC